jgi:glycosyltransferase involved in cell wall biosynthesis
LPVDESDLAPTRSRADIRRELGVDERSAIVGTFAHLSPKKGYSDLVEAAGQVLRELPTAQFWCFGDGKLREELTARATELGIGDRFRLLGYRRDVPDLMRAIDVMALPSHREPFGLVYVEAGLCRRPVIACQSGGAPEIVEHGESGLLVPARTPEALAEAILTILGNPEQARQMGDRGYEICRERFTWDRYLTGLNQVYDMVASRGRSTVAAWQLPMV